MKKNYLMILPALAMLLSGCGSNSNSGGMHRADLEPDNTEYEDQEKLVVDYNSPKLIINPKQASTSYPSKVTINYHNDSGGCATKAFYFWFNGINGAEYDPDSVIRDNNGKDVGMTITFDFTKAEYKEFYKRKMFMIIKEKGSWSGKSDDTPIDYADFTLEADGSMNIWVLPGEGSALELYDTEEDTKVDRILYATFTNWKTIEVIAKAVPSNLKLYAFSKYYTTADPNTQYYRKPNCLILETGAPSSTTPVTYNGLDAVKFSISLSYTIHINMQYELDAIFSSKPSKTMIKYVSFDSLYNTTRFKTYYQYSGDDLGVTYSRNETTFKVWAPTSSSVRLLIYDAGTPENVAEEYGRTDGNDYARGYDMVYQPGGIWALTVTNQNLDGKYYTYWVCNSLGKNEVVDPYAKACNVSGTRGMICDFATTNPRDWNTIPTKWDGDETYDIKSANELSVYEVHIRDLTTHETWQGQSKRGTYAAFSEKGTTYTKGTTTVKTGFDHIEELGVKAVQLLPIFDQDNNESDMSFNWGYNPLNYNCLEGGYSSDPYNGKVRISEFKSLVKAFAENENHTRVIMDVVYNHVSSAPASNFNKLMPKYYFRYAADGSYYNGSGCGNEVRSEAPMMRKFIVESLCWWASEYKIKGFRFDLMALIDTRTLKEAAKALYKIDPDIVMYGEGWRGDGDGFHGEGTSAETDKCYSELYATADSVAVGGFNDTGRNALRGGNDQGWGSSSHLPSWGYMQQGPSDASAENRGKLADMLWGIHTGKGGNPNQTVNYASCHDNWTVFDQLYYTLGDSGKGIAPAIVDVMNGSTAAHAFVMASNGIAFMLGGEELFRTKRLDAAAREEVTADTYENMYGKYVSHNSYNSNDTVNQFDWSRKISVEGISSTKYFNAFKAAVKLHTTMPKYQYSDPFPYSKTSAGNPIDGTSWAGSELGSSTPQTYQGCCGFQLDEYFVFLAGRQWGWVQFGDVPKSSKIYEFGPNEFDNANGTVNVGDINSNKGGAIVIYKRGK